MQHKRKTELVAEGILKQNIYEGIEEINMLKSSQIF